MDSKCNTLYRYAHDIDILVFNYDIVKSELITNPNAELSQFCEQYHTTLQTLLDEQAPVRTKSIQIEPSAQFPITSLLDHAKG